MIRIYLSVICFVFTLSTAFSQKQAPKVSHVSYEWMLNTPDYKNTGQILSTLKLKVTEGTLPAKGWTLYFNGAAPSPADNDTSLFRVKIVNGDFFKLQPGPGFKGLSKANPTVTFNMVSRHLKNYTDLSKGLYIVFDNDPKNPQTLKGRTGSLIDYTTREKQLAEKLYKEQANIKDINPAELPPVFPTPVAYTTGKGSFRIAPGVKIVADRIFTNEAAYLTTELTRLLRLPAAGAPAPTSSGAIRFKQASMPSEAYEISVTEKEILITAGDAAGAFYAIQSLKTALPGSLWGKPAQTITVPVMAVKDAPRFAHRAFMIDIARNFQQKKEILKLIDMLSLYKVNVLHMHLNDDEGWRIEIPSLPELTQIGSKRTHTIDEGASIIPSYGSGVKSDNAGSGYLSKADYIEVLKYATQRHIRVIPEFETPGHARAAIKSMNARYKKYMALGNQAEATKYLLRDLNDESVYRSVQGFDDNVINPALPSVYTFLARITDDVIAMHKEAGAPLKTIHFGGDEVPAGVWERSPAVKALLEKDKTINSVDEMWYYYFNKVNAMLKQRGLYLSGWEEIGLKKELVNGSKKMVVDPRFAGENFHTDVWNNLAGNEDLAYRLANAGYKVVLTNVTNMYLDLSYADDYAEPGQYWGGHVDVNKPFSFIPFNYYKNQKENERGQPLAPGHFDNMTRLTETGKANIVGLQAPLWSEIITTPETFEYLLLPKVMGLAERAWAPDPVWATEPENAVSEVAYQQAWSVFVNVLGKKELPRMDHYAGGFGYRIPPAAYMVSGTTVFANNQLPGFTIRYTTDGSNPTAASKVFPGSIDLASLEKTPKLFGGMKLRVFNKNGRGGRTVVVR